VIGANVSSNVDVPVAMSSLGGDTGASNGDVLVAMSSLGGDTGASNVDVPVAMSSLGGDTGASNVDVPVAISWLGRGTGASVPTSTFGGTVGADGKILSRIPFDCSVVEANILLSNPGFSSEFGA
jgi:hypothetical protein